MVLCLPHIPPPLRESDQIYAYEVFETLAGVKRLFCSYNQWVEAILDEDCEMGGTLVCPAGNAAPQRLPLPLEFPLG